MSKNCSVVDETVFPFDAISDIIVNEITNVTMVDSHWGDHLMNFMAKSLETL